MAKRKTADKTEQLVRSIVEGIREVKGQEIVSLDLRNLQSAAADFFVICHGNSTTQVEAIARSVEKETSRDMGEEPRFVEGLRNSKWVLMDYFNVLVHIFEKDARNYYELEDLWSDARLEKFEERA